MRIPAASNEYLPGIGEFDALLASDENREPQPRFELNDLLAKGWLRDPQSFCSASEIELFRQRKSCNLKPDFDINLHRRFSTVTTDLERGVARRFDRPHSKSS